MKKHHTPKMTGAKGIRRILGTAVLLLIFVAAGLVVQADGPCGNCGTPTGSTTFTAPCTSPCGGTCTQIEFPSGKYEKCSYNCVSAYPCLTDTYTGPVWQQDGDCVEEGSPCHCGYLGSPYSSSVIGLPYAYQSSTPSCG
jgi:hypothetical protein